jgi:hypothetical protein
MKTVDQLQDFSTVKYFGTLYDGIGIWRVNRVTKGKVFATRICTNDDDSEWEGTFDIKSRKMIDGDCDKKFYADYVIAWVPTAEQQEVIASGAYANNKLLGYMLCCVQKTRKRVG